MQVHFRVATVVVSLGAGVEFLCGRRTDSRVVVHVSGIEAQCDALQHLVELNASVLSSITVLER